MTLATYTDANAHLDGTKIKFANAGDPAFVASSTSADRVVLAALFDLYPDHALLWQASAGTGFEETPDLVKEAASLLYAAYFYSAKYSENSLAPNDYAQRLEARALAILTGLNDGTMTLPGIPYAGGELGLSEADFWPNNLTVYDGQTEMPPGKHIGDPIRAFDMKKVF